MTRDALSLLFPGSCLSCGTVLDSIETAEFPLCKECMTVLAHSQIYGARCEVCSSHLISEIKICTRCRGNAFSFDRAISLFEYTGIIKELIHQFKFEGRRSLAVYFADVLGKKAVDCFPGIPIVPVPSSPQSKKKRGWDQMRVIAKKIEKIANIPSFSVLDRKAGIQQKELGVIDRASNLKGSIVFDDSHESSELREVLLLDDVLTTGATASECARILKDNGIQKVYVLTLALD
jgi:competence protein ComFC